MTVVGGESVVRYDQQGRAVSTRRPVANIPADLSVFPSVKPDEVWDRVGGEGSLELVVDADPSLGARLSYRVMTAQPGNPLSLERVFVDAKTGMVYRREPLVWHAQKGKVYLSNPKKTPQLAEVLLPHLSNSQTLASEDVVAMSCKDPGICKKDQTSGSYFYDCDFDFATKPDGSGNFYYGFQSHTAPSDGLAEVSAYYHLSRATDAIRSMTGIKQLVKGGVVAIANFRMATDPQACNKDEFTGKKPFEAFDNAAFVPGGFGLFAFPHSAILIGQGTSIDYAYDGDVLIHELGHGYHHAVAPELSTSFIDKFGLNTMPGGLMEGYADLVALALTDDPEIGEYAGGNQPIRVLDNGARCPEHLTGEMHMDSEIFTGAVYEARKLVANTAKTKNLFDGAVLSSVAGLGAYDDFSGAGKNVVEEVTLAIGAPAGNKVKEVLKKRGVLACSRVAPADPKQFLYMTGYEKGKNTPGPLQFKYELTEAATKIGVIASYLAPSLAQGDLVMVVRRGKDPIAWKKSAADLTGNYQWNATFQPLPSDDKGAVATVSGTFPPDTYHIQFVHRGEGQDVVAGIQFGHAAANSATADIVPLARQTAEAAPADEMAGCQISNTGIGSALLVALGLLVSRRRRRLE